LLWCRSCNERARTAGIAKGAMNKKYKMKLKRERERERVRISRKIRERERK